MKFEDLKLPPVDLAYDRYENRYRVARAVYDQMREHYEAKLAKTETEELFEHPDMPGKKFRRLKVEEEIREGDWTNAKENPLYSGWSPTVCNGMLVKSCDSNYYYREVPQPAPEWHLPDPPPGQQWHRTDWTQDMLPEGWRPLLLGEPQQTGDQWFLDDLWSPVTDYPEKSLPHHCHRRTRRPLPALVEYVPLEPGDVPPGSAVRWRNDTFWDLIVSVRPGHMETEQRRVPWDIAYFDCEILRPGSKTWEPCKKPKP